MLLEQSQMQAEEMKAQEEEMRQNMEELQATQEEVERKSTEIEGFMSSIHSSAYVLEYDLNGNVISCKRFLYPAHWGFPGTNYWFTPCR